MGIPSLVIPREIPRFIEEEMAEHVQGAFIESSLEQPRRRDINPSD